MKAFFLCLAGLAAAAPLVTEAPEITGIQTTSGNIIGHRARWPENADVDEYLGIPFAAAPVGDNRFAAPRPYKAKDGATIRADDYMDACMQPVDGIDGIVTKLEPALLSYSVGMGGVPGRKYSEDCLGLNIWTKSNSTGPPKAVMIWIYGGGFAAGDTAAPYYNGARYAAEQDVIVASIGYRLNIFGFPSAPGLSDYNLGLLDQRLAVEWLRENIAKFGGDPNRMTLFGESAGGMSVDLYAYAWTKDPIVNGFISQSGTAFLGTKFSQNNTAWFKASEKAGCGGQEEAEKTIDCMRKLPAKALMKSLGNGLSALSASMGTFGPTVDEKVVFSNYPARAAAGMFIQKPFLAGTTDNEAGILTGFALAAAKSAANYKFLPGVVTGTIGLVQSAVDAVRLSGPATSISSRVSPIIDSVFNCPTRGATNARFKTKVPVWRYRFMATFPNTMLYPEIGAFHSIDCPVVFGTTSRNVQKMPSSPEQDQFVSSVMTAWAAFAKDPVNGLPALGWPKYDPTTASLVRLGYENKPKLTFTDSVQYDQACDTLARLKAFPPA